MEVEVGLMIAMWQLWEGTNINNDWCFTPFPGWWQWVPQNKDICPLPETISSHSLRWSAIWIIMLSPFYYNSPGQEQWVPQNKNSRPPPEDHLFPILKTDAAIHLYNGWTLLVATNSFWRVILCMVEFCFFFILLGCHNSSQI